VNAVPLVEYAAKAPTVAALEVASAVLPIGRWTE
jgi:hypothetical protein